MIRKILTIKIILTIILLIIICYTIPIHADITKPFVFNINEQYDGGLLINTPDNTFYFIKKNWFNNNETIYKWNGIQRNNTQAEVIYNIDIIDAVYFKNKLRLIVKENNKIYITTFDNNKYNKNSSNECLIPISNKPNPNIKWIVNDNIEKLFLISDGILYDVQINDNIELKYISDNVIECNVFSHREDYSLSYIVDRGDIGLLYFLNSKNESEYISRIHITNNIKIFNTKNKLIVSNAIDKNSNIYATIIDIQSKTIVESDWINTNTNLIISDDNSNRIFTISNNGGGFVLNKMLIENINDISKWDIIDLEYNLRTPLKLMKVDNKLFIFFSHHLMIFNEDMLALSLDEFDYSVFNDKDININVMENYVIISSNNMNYVYSLDANTFWWFNKYIKLVYRYAVPLLLFLICFIIYRKYRNQKRLLDVMLDLPSSGFLFIVNRIGKLIKINDGGKQLLGMSDNIPMRKHFSYYCNTEHLQQINDLVELGLKNKYSFQQKINIIENNNSMEWLCSLIPLNNITGMFKGIILTGIDITEALDRQLLTNWAQLAHDMQTNLSTIRLNAEQLDLNSEEDNNRKNKILHQVLILVHRIRDIVTVGRDDRLDLTNTNSIDLCNEIRNEFDDNIFSGIRFEMKLNDFNFLCDRSKLIRAIRNAVENAIKYMKNKGGVITISCSKDIHNITISVKDTGIGMNETTRKKIFTPFYSTTRQLGGHGIGTIIMQRVVEQHGGKLIIESQLDIGTEIIFLLPDLSRKNK